MILSEALMQRADLQRRLEQIKARLLRNVRVQEGEKPAEDVAELMAEFEREVTALTALVQRINRTNSATVFDGALTLADAIAVRDGLRKRFAVYNELAATAVFRQDRYTRSEVRFVMAIDVAAVQAQADQFAREARELDTRIQATNWKVELVE
jgi:hypothetical protein